MPDPGATLAQYRLLEKIGAGGMGEVWKALDTSLDREVAIKLLPESVAGDPDRLARFEREAKLLATLNHPHIASIYGLHQSGHARFLAMELVPGSDLAARLEAGPLALADAVPIARQVAEALEAAHDSGVVHRDLKPGNIQVTPDGTAKVLDFGLAKAFLPDAESGSASMSPTLTAAATREGVILGTAAYMSPEQAKGKSVDRRADIWAFGVVLYEMLSHRTLFRGDGISETLAHVMMTPIDWTALPASTPASLRRLLERCLERDPRRRLRDIGEARILLEDLEAGRAPAAAQVAPGGKARRSWRPWLVGLVAGLALGVVAGAIFLAGGREPPRKLRRYSFPLELLPGATVQPAISPDGEYIAYAHGEKLWLRSLSRFQPRELAAMPGLALPFWSPDSRWVGFGAKDRLYKVSIDGGEPVPVTRSPKPVDDSSSFSWGDDGRIVFTSDGSIYEVPERGGTAALLHGPDLEHEVDLHEVCALPGGRGALFTVHRNRDAGGWGADTLAVFSDGERKVVWQTDLGILMSPVYSPTGHILVAIERDASTLWAVPFSLDRLEVTGEPVQIAANGARPSASNDGTLVFADAEMFVPLRQLVLIDMKGNVVREVGEPQRALGLPTVSPDGRRVAVVVREGDLFVASVLDMDRGITSRITFGKGLSATGDWLPGGEELLVTEDMATANARLVRMRADGTGEPTVVQTGNVWLSAATRDGRYALFTTRESTGFDIWLLDLEAAEPAARPFLATAAEEEWPAPSPDGRYLAYESDESGRAQVYLTGFPSGAGRWQVSPDGGSFPRWTPDGKNLFYMQDDKLFVVDIDLDPSPRIGRPRVFLSGLQVPPVRIFDVMPDGSGILLSRDVPRQQDVPDAPEIFLVENWTAELDASAR